MYVRRHVTDQRYASHVEVVRQQGRAPMDVSALMAAIGRLRAETCERGSESAGYSDHISELGVAIGALRHRAGGRESKGGGKGESRERCHCDTGGHWARDCPEPKKAEGEGKVRPANSFTLDLEEGISLGSLVFRAARRA